MSLTLTLGPQGHKGMFILSIPTYHVKMAMIRGYQDCQMPISRFDLERPISDLEGKNSKFRRMRSLRMVPKNMSMHFHCPTIKTVGGDSKNAYNRPKTCLLYTSPSPRDRQKSRMPSSA